MNKNGMLLVILGTEIVQFAYIDEKEDETTKYS